MIKNIEIKTGTPEQTKIIQDYLDLIHRCNELITHYETKDIEGVDVIDYVYLITGDDIAIRIEHRNKLKNKKDEKNSK